MLSLSVVEGGPLSLLEAMHCGIPSVITKTGIYKECLDKDNVYILESVDDFVILDILKFAKINRGKNIHNLAGMNLEKPYHLS